MSIYDTAADYERAKIMEKIRIIIERHKKEHLPSVLFTDDFETPAEKFVCPGYELMSDTIIEVENWPEDFPIGFRLMHDPSLMVQKWRQHEKDELENQWNPDDADEPGKQWDPDGEE